ncbi:hypothetical protein PRZ48_014048 [Zasmidium cellare]|uniref:DUF6604 domain-containing protein n=1 Tax=Zasmidium cellare TaxID=395010 RepID=A0ABR0DZT4_ZASCE|nr:hypothetical protein PRZ48_014048 [Zasmidium cellare]
MAEQNFHSGSNHDRYKSGTKRLCQWLVTVSNQCTDITGLVSALPPRNSHAQVVAQSVQLQTDEYISLARTISQAVKDGEPGIFVPRFVLDNIDTVIRLRQEEHEFYAATSMIVHKELSEDDKSHKHFIQVLRQVWAILGPAHTTSSQRAANELNKASWMNAILDNDDQRQVIQTGLIATGQSFKRSAKARNISNSKATPTKTVNCVDLSKATFDVGNEANDPKHDLYCHLQDMHSVRTSCSETLEAWRDGKVSTLSAIMTAKVSCALIRCANVEFSLRHPELDTYGKILSFLGLKIVAFGGEPVVYLVNEGGTSSQVPSSQGPANVLELLYPIGAKMSSTFQDCLSRHARNSMQYKKDVSGSFDPPSSGEVEWLTYHRLVQVLLENADMISRHVNSKSFEELDDFTEGLVSHNVELWVNCSCEIYADLFDALGDEVSQGVAMVEENLDRMLGLQLATSGGPGEEEGKQTSDNISRAMEGARRCHARLKLETPELSRGDMSSALYKKQEGQVTDMECPEISGLERVLPINAGISTYLLMKAMLDHSCNIIHNRFAVQAMAYLYMATIHGKLLESSWADMDHIMQSYHPEGVWLPKPEPNRHASWFQSAYKTSIGMKFYELNRKKVGQTFPDQKKARHFMGCEFTHRLSEHERRTEHDSVKTSHHKRAQIVLHEMATERRQRECGAGSNERYEFSPLELLTEFQISFAKGEPILNFDLGLFPSSCEDFLRHIQKKLSPESTIDETQFACVILEDYAKDGDMLAKAAEIIEEHILTKGDHFASFARTRSAGKKPKGPRLYDVADELQVQRAEDSEKFKGAGTSVARIGKVVALYHPRLTAKTLEKARQHTALSKCVSLPAYMMRTGSANVEDTVSKGSKQTAEASRDNIGPGIDERKDSLDPIDSKEDNEETVGCSGPASIDEMEQGNEMEDRDSGEVEHARDSTEPKKLADVEKATEKTKSKKKRKKGGSKKKLSEKEVVSWNFS